MKKIPQKHIIILGILTLILACSTKKDNFATRNFQALNTKYNVLYNGGVAYDKGIATVEQQYLDNYWETLPVERQQPEIDSSVSELAKQKTDAEKTKNPDFELAELKATKAIQRRSMNIDGTERNTQIDEAYLLLGKSRYYDQRFIPALEAFNYILYKYPKSDKINDAKIWVEKTNMRLDNDNLAIGNLTKLLKEIKFKDQTFADANAILAQAYINVKQKDSAISKLTNAIKFTKKNDEKARFSFIKAQLQEQLEQPDSAFATYQSIIDMKRKSPRIYTMHAQTRQANQFDFAKGDTVIFLEKYNKLLADRENRPFLDVLNHQMGLFYEQAKKPNQAIKFYNKSLKAKSQDTYLDASNYRNSAEIYFDKAKYVTAGKYYDSTMTKLKVRTREFNFIKKKRENLDDVIKYEGIVAKNDSILKVLAMSPAEKNTFYESYITKLKADEEKAKLLADKTKLADKNKNNANSKTNDSGNLLTNDDVKTAGANPPKNDIATNGFGGQSNFYFYNPTTLEYGRIEFRKIWGDRKLQDNWRNSALDSTSNVIENTDDDSKDLTEKDIKKTTEKTTNDSKTNADPKYDVASYITQLPKKQSDIATLVKDRNFAYFQLGVIYKEKFKEYKLAQDKLETLLSKNPEERLILPSMYNLFKIYQILNENDKAAAMKAAIIRQYPTSRYAQILSKSESDSLDSDSPEVVYNELYRMYQNAEYRNLIPLVDKAIEHFTGDEIVPKLELLKANNIGKVSGLAAYKKALNFVSLTYPNVQEGKDAEAIITKDIAAMEELQFNLEKPMSWKLVYRMDCNSDGNAKPLLQKITKFLNTKTYHKLITSTDLYLLNEDFIVIHNIKDENQAKDVMTILKEYKDYKVAETPIIISSDNYKIVQIKKNLDEYLRDPKKAPKPVTKKEVMQSKPSKEVPDAIKKLMKENETKNQKSIAPPNLSQQQIQGDEQNVEREIRQKK